MIIINRGDSMETKHDKFKRLAELRVNNALKAMELIGNLANKKNYDYTEEEQKKILKTLKSSVQMIEQKFNDKGINKFKL